MGTNPRDAGTNPLRGTDLELARIWKLRDRAHRILNAAGVTWCDRCGDAGQLELEAGRWVPCPCPVMTATTAGRLVRRFAGTDHLERSPHLVALTAGRSSAT